MHDFPGSEFSKQDIEHLEGYLAKLCSQGDPGALENISDTLMRHEIECISNADIEESTGRFRFDTIPVEKHATGASGKGFGYSFTLQSDTFDPGKHRIEYQAGRIGKIDGCRPWGTEGGMPRQQLSGLNVSYNGKSLRLSPEIVSALYDPNFGCNPPNPGETRGYCYTEILRSADKKRVYLLLRGGDAAGSYNAIWAFTGGDYAGRVVLPGE